MHERDVRGSIPALAAKSHSLELDDLRAVLEEAAQDELKKMPPNAT